MNVCIVKRTTRTVYIHTYTCIGYKRKEEGEICLFACDVKSKLQYKILCVKSEVHLKTHCLFQITYWTMLPCEQSAAKGLTRATPVFTDISSK